MKLFTKQNKKRNKPGNVDEIIFFHTKERNNESELHMHCIVMNFHFKNEILKIGDGNECD